jgi:hypothetical protein
MRQSRTKVILRVLGSIGFVAIGCWEISTGRTDAQLIGCAAVGLFGLFAIGWTWSLVRPGTLTIGPQGVEERLGWSTRRWAWGELQSIRLAKVSRASMVAFDYAPGWPPRKMTGFNRSISGVDGGLGGGWPLKPAELVDLLNEAKRRWG